MVSYGYGFALILFPLYLKRVGYPSVEVGIIVFAAMLINALLAVFAGMLADHYGRKYVLIALLFFFSASSLTILDEKNPVALSLLAGLAGLTSGATGGPIGSGGPLGAVQTAIISEATDRDTMPKILGIAAILEMASAMAGAFSTTVISLCELPRPHGRGFPVHRYAYAWNTCEVFHHRRGVLIPGRLPYVP